MKLTKIVLCLAAMAVLTSAISCVNYQVYSSGNCYKVGDVVVGPNGKVYISKKNDNCCIPLTNTAWWTEQPGSCDGPCAGIQAYQESQNYPTGTRVQLDGVIYENTRPSDSEYPQPFLYQNPWKAVGTCYINCITAPNFIPGAGKVYQYNEIVKFGGYLYISLQGWNTQHPNQDFGYQGASWLQIQICIPQGVLQNYDITGKSNLVPCYLNWYADYTTSDELDACKGKSEYVLVGGYHSSNPNLLLVAAYGHSNAIFQSHSYAEFAYSNAQVYDNNVYWYRSSRAFGFSDVVTLRLSPADAYGVFTSDPFTNTRVSWHLDLADGGWRLGTVIWLNSDYNYKKVIYLVQ